MIRRNLKLIVPVLPLVAALPLLQGCASAVVGGAASAGVVGVQERTVGDAIDDRLIASELAGRYFQFSEKLFLDVDMEVLEGRVLLTGKVETLDARLQAEGIAWRIKGVKAVHNEIQVTTEGGLGSYIRDVGISSQLRARLLGADNIFAINYTVETVNGIVYIMGIAQNDDELQRVTELARTIKGVQRVRTFVRVLTEKERAANQPPKSS